MRAALAIVVAATSLASADPQPAHPARCDDPCLFLTDTPIDKLAGTFKATCGGNAGDLGFLDCTRLDYARNCIYAAHGVVYKKAPWKKRFAEKPWYAAKPDINPKTVLSELELANVKELRERARACRKGLRISGGDYDRIKAWFAALPKPPLPATVFTDEGASDAAGFYKKLAASLGKRKPALGGQVVAEYLGDLRYTGADYPSDDSPVGLVDALGVPVKQLRGARVSVPDAKQEAGEWKGIHLDFIFDDKDVLRGLEITRYFYAEDE